MASGVLRCFIDEGVDGESRNVTQYSMRENVKTNRNQSGGATAPPPLTDCEISLLAAQPAVYPIRTSHCHLLLC